MQPRREKLHDMPPRFQRIAQCQAIPLQPALGRQGDNADGDPHRNSGRRRAPASCRQPVDLTRHQRRQFSAGPSMPRILIIAGEASGDLHGSSLAQAILASAPDAELWGLGGPRMRAAGVRLISGIDRLDIIGVPSLSELWRALSVFRKLSAYIATSPFDAVILVDNPGLNMRLAGVARRSGHRVIYFVAPQVWAWNARRIHKLRLNIDLLLPILPFEEAYFRQGGIDCRFVGHPIMDHLEVFYDGPALRSEFGLDPRAQVIGLLPGSRTGEVSRLLPVMLDAARLLAAKAEADGVRRQFVIAHAPSLPRELIESMATVTGLPVTIVSDRTEDVVAACDALAVASGTATLQTALVGRPMVIAYRTSALTAAVFRRLIRVPWIGLANLVAGRLVARELVQDDATGQAIAAELESLLASSESRATAEALASELRASLGGPGAITRVAAEILDHIARAPKR